MEGSKEGLVGYKLYSGKIDMAMATSSLVKVDYPGYKEERPSSTLESVKTAVNYATMVVEAAEKRTPIATILPQLQRK